MPNLFALPPARSGPINYTATTVIPLNGSYSLASTTTLYSSLWNSMFNSDHNHVTFVNDGTLWNIGDSLSGVLTGYYTNQVTNSGTMIAQATAGNAYVVTVGSGGFGVYNTGSMYAIATGIAVGVTHYDPNVRIENSGRIASYAPTGPMNGVQAIGIAMYNGGVLTNNAGASILAEGVAATAIIFGRGSLFGTDVILNNGWIEAWSLTPGSPSYGIVAGGVPSEILKLVNNGYIKADIAWSSYDPHPEYGPRGTDLLTNNAGGTIVGRIETGRGEDQLINSGSITGDIDLGEGNDLFDTSAGIWNGAADLGWGNDVFIGSAGTDVVQGDRGNDRLLGYGGNDLLLGGAGYDLLVGAGGNDGVYGELGDDEIMQEGGDKIFGGEGNDLINLADYTFSSIDGGAGYDRIVLASGARTLDFSAVAASGRITGVEHIVLNGSKHVIIRAGDVAALTGGGNQLVLTASSSDHVYLAGNWVSIGTQSVLGTAYAAYESDGVRVLLAPEANVALGNSPPAAGGLDAVASGSDAPLAGSLHGSQLSNPILPISFYTIGGFDQTLVVDVGEIWQATNAAVIYGQTLTNGLLNFGTLESTFNSAATSGYPTVWNSLGFIVNAGVIRSTGPSVSAINVRGSLENSGLITATSDFGRALAAEIGTVGTQLVFQNRGNIIATSGNGTALAVQIDDANGPSTAIVGTNEGLISATGGAGTIGLSFLTARTFLNSGSILANVSAGSSVADQTAVMLYNGTSLQMGNSLINQGSIVGPIAIRASGAADNIYNSGRIDGLLQLGSGNDRVENSGSITGVITFQDGDDVYVGVNATARATVDGGNGGDTIIGGAYWDRITGGLDRDSLTGGLGSDSFFDTAAGLNGDTITDFSRGDRIVISDAAAGLAISWNGTEVRYGSTSITIANVQNPGFTVRAAAEGGIEIVLGGPPIISAASLSVTMPASAEVASPKSAVSHSLELLPSAGASTWTGADDMVRPHQLFGSDLFGLA